jgi:hypothetical protein
MLDIATAYQGRVRAESWQFGRPRPELGTMMDETFSDLCAPYARMSRRR